MNIWEKILYRGQSKHNGEVKVTESFGLRKLIADGFVQSQTLKNGSAFPYWDAMVPEGIALGEGSRVLILGLGAGTVAKIVNYRFRGVQIDGVDIDPLIIEIGKKYFAMSDSNLNIIQEDVSKFIKDARYKYDLACVDVFEGGEVPGKVEKEGFFRNVKSLLKEEAVMSINKIYSGERELRRFEELIKQVFPRVDSKVISGSVASDNLIIYAYND